MRLYLVALLLLGACASNPMQGARYWRLEECASTAYASVRFLKPDGTVLAVVPKKSCQALASASEKIQAQANYSLWRVYIASVEQRNAFATRDKEGHSVAVVTMGMLTAIRDDEDAWAGLLGHEVAHHVKRHSEGRKEAQDNARATGQVAANVIGALIPGLGGAVAGTVGGTATQMAMYGAYTRPQEAEADELGLQWMVDAGYDPRGMSRLFVALAGGDPSSGSTFSFLSTHPANEDRQRAVETFIAARGSQPATQLTASASPKTAGDAGSRRERSQGPLPAVSASASNWVPGNIKSCADAVSGDAIRKACASEGCEGQVLGIAKYCPNAWLPDCYAARTSMATACAQDSNGSACGSAIQKLAQSCTAP